MWEATEKANLLNLVKPRFLSWKVAGKGISCSFVQWILWKVTDHAEKPKLSVVEESFTWETTSHEVDESLWSVLSVYFKC